MENKIEEFQKKLLAFLRENHESLKETLEYCSEHPCTGCPHSGICEEVEQEIDVERQQETEGDDAESR